MEKIKIESAFGTASFFICISMISQLIGKQIINIEEAVKIIDVSCGLPQAFESFSLDAEVVATVDYLLGIAKKIFQVQKI